MTTCSLVGYLFDSPCLSLVSPFLSPLPLLQVMRREKNQNNQKTKQQNCLKYFFFSLFFFFFFFTRNCASFHNGACVSDPHRTIIIPVTQIERIFQNMLFRPLILSQLLVSFYLLGTTWRSSTSKSRSALGGMTPPPAPLGPYARDEGQWSTAFSPTESFRKPAAGSECSTLDVQLCHYPPPYFFFHFYFLPLSYPDPST
jgi:hypothetical protein